MNMYIYKKLLCKKRFLKQSLYELYIVVITDWDSYFDIGSLWLQYLEETIILHSRSMLNRCIKHLLDVNYCI